MALVLMASPKDMASNHLPMVNNRLHLLTPPRVMVKHSSSNLLDISHSSLPIHSSQPINLPTHNQPTLNSQPTHSHLPILSSLSILKVLQLGLNLHLRGSASSSVLKARLLFESS